jgi:hypothetical protein
MLFKQCRQYTLKSEIKSTSLRIMNNTPLAWNTVPIIINSVAWNSFQRRVDYDVSLHHILRDRIHTSINYTLFRITSVFHIATTNILICIELLYRMVQNSSTVFQETVGGIIWSRNVNNWTVFSGSSPFPSDDVYIVATLCTIMIVHTYQIFPSTHPWWLADHISEAKVVTSINPLKPKLV